MGSKHSIVLVTHGNKKKIFNPHAGRHLMSFTFVMIMTMMTTTWFDEERPTNQPGGRVQPGPGRVGLGRAGAGRG